MTDEEESVQFKLPVRKSAISSGEGGIGRIHTSHMDMFADDESPMAVISNEKKKIVVKIVSDRLAPQNFVTLREKDIDDLDVAEGDEVAIEPYHKLTDDLKERWQSFKARFKKDEEEEGED